jgi:hypothetical protein
VLVFINSENTQIDIKRELARVSRLGSSIEVNMKQENSQELEG